MDALINKAEKQAEKAENLPILKGVKLLHIRNSIEEILKYIGNGDIFLQYTKHDISHVDEMLKLLEWIIPKTTAEKITDAEWLMMVLAVYFHDLGMVVTKHEFNTREESGFPEYRQQVYDGDMGIEYRDKVRALDYEESEKFLYQEFVRSNHATRSKNIILGEENNSLGNVAGIKDIIKDLLSGLDSAFKRDLAKLCESHGLGNIDDFTTYKTKEHYANTDRAVVNLHYIALILRTADLLHITCDRTPTIQFHLIDPTDPKSILEWQKQMGVRAVTAMDKTNAEGEIVKDLQPDTVKVTAYFDKPEQAEAYFGLISYLNFAKKQLQRNYEVAKKAIKTQGAEGYDYPWNDINTESIDVKDFEKKQLQFSLDQNSILQLLVGHTLYNDYTVVLRELTQNALDAIALQNVIEDKRGDTSKTLGHVNIQWESGRRQLTFTDNGTGMSIIEIESYLLKVGASKYRTPEFKKNYPDFSAISRFGIGMLTCFLIANDIDIITSSEEEDFVAAISIRKVDGKYLLRKHQRESVDSSIRKHGTKIILNVRPEIDLDALEAELRKWIVFPSVKVTLVVDSSTPKIIGYGSPAEALRAAIESANVRESLDGQLSVIDKSNDGLDIAFVVRYNKPLKTKEFFDDINMLSESNELKSIVGTCINGIRINSDSPGFDGFSVFAVANATGRDVPTTNVVRSEIEVSERNNLLKKIYSAYADHIQDQIKHLQDNGYSLEWSVEEVEYLMYPLLVLDRENPFGSYDESASPVSESLLISELKNIKCIIMSQGSSKEAVSPNEISELPEIGIISGHLIKSAGLLLKEVPSTMTVQDLINGLTGDNAPKIDISINILCNYDAENILHNRAISEKEVVSFVLHEKDRRVDLKLSKAENRWLTVDTQPLGDSWNFRHRTGKVNIPLKPIKITGIDDEAGINVIGQTFLFPNHFLTAYILMQNEKFQGINDWNWVFPLLLSILLNKAVMEYTNEDTDTEDLADFIRRNFQSENRRGFWEAFDNLIDLDELADVALSERYHIFNPDKWYRDSSSIY